LTTLSGRLEQAWPPPPPPPSSRRPGPTARLGRSST
jgi:hypothetical protein